MRSSLRRLVLSSVLICYAMGIGAVFIYLQTRTWSDEAVRADGAFLVYQLLEATPVHQRQAKLVELRPNFSRGLNLEARTTLEQRLGRSISPGEHLRSSGSFREEWYYIAFKDSDLILKVGPYNPRQPNGHYPIGLIIAFVAFPALAGFFALQIERGISRVETAAEALSEGEWTARVNPDEGLSKELAIRFNEMAARIERLVRDRDELIQAVSHELGSPLTRIRLHLELFDSELEPQRVESMRCELDALDELVAELLSYVQSDNAELKRETLRPAQRIADLVELASLELVGTREVAIHFEVDADLELFADARGFIRAIENLIRNAMRYADTAVWVRAQTTDGAVEVIIEDDGPGIPEDMREAVRTPFIRLNADRNRSTGGAGLGLAIVDRVVTRHGGALEIGDSSAGGARIVTRWPK